MSQAQPGSDPSQIPSQALELALRELEDRLPSASPQDENEALSLDQAMAYVRSHTSRDVRPVPATASLFDSLPDNPHLDGNLAPAGSDHPTLPPTPSTPPAAPDPRSEASAPAPSVAIASGEKTKARDIIAAIRTLKAIEQEQRPATAEEKQILARFAGFGPVALSIFPDPVTGTYKDAGWQALGEELKTLLTPDEYDSAKRTTFNAFYTSPTVIAAIHEAIARLGVPANATILEPGCGTGNFMSHGQPEACASSASRWIPSPGGSPRRCTPSQDIRIENFRDTKLPEDRIDAVVGNVPFADVKLDYQRPEALPARLLLRQVRRRPEARRRAGAGHVAFHARQAERRHPRVPRLEGRFRRGHPPALGCLQAGRNRRGDRHRVPSQACTGASRPTMSIPTGWASPRLRSMAQRFPINRYFLNHPEMVLGNWTRKDTLYGGEGYSVTGNGDLAEQLKDAIGRLPEVRAAASASASAEAASPGLHAAAARAPHRRRQLLRRRRQGHPPDRRTARACPSSTAARR